MKDKGFAFPGSHWVLRLAVLGIALPCSLFPQWSSCTGGTGACLASGKVGIGTTDPAFSLHLINPGDLAMRIERLSANSWNYTDFWTGSHQDGLVGSNPFADFAVMAAKDLVLYSYYTERMRIQANGTTVFKGTGVSFESPSLAHLVTIDGAGNLTANGTVKASAVVVTAAPGADSVFEPGYKLAALSEVASYIEDHHHLPGIPSAREMEAGGSSLGEMQEKLLAKIEELTLHMIRAEKEARELRDEVARLRDKAGEGKK